MSFNHDTFTQTTNYLDLDARLQWYIDTVRPHLDILRQLAEKNPAKVRLLFSRDPVMKKLFKIGRSLSELRESINDGR